MGNSGSCHKCELGRLMVDYPYNVNLKVLVKLQVCKTVCEKVMGAHDFLGKHKLQKTEYHVCAVSHPAANMYSFASDLN